MESIHRWETSRILNFAVNLSLYNWLLLIGIWSTVDLVAPRSHWFHTRPSIWKYTLDFWKYGGVRRRSPVRTYEMQVFFERESLTISTTKAWGVPRAGRWRTTRRPCFPNGAVHSDPADRVLGSSLHRSSLSTSVILGNHFLKDATRSKPTSCSDNWQHHSKKHQTIFGNLSRRVITELNILWLSVSSQGFSFDDADVSCSVGQLESTVRN